MSQGSSAEEASAEVRWEMPALTLADILDRGLVFAAKDGSRPILETVYIEYQKGGVTFAAANGFLPAGAAPRHRRSRWRVGGLRPAP